MGDGGVTRVYLTPNPDSATFDKAAADAMRSCLRHYDCAPADIRSILENIAIAQEQMEWMAAMKAGLSEPAVASGTKRS
jgi:hypothetical protein